MAEIESWVKASRKEPQRQELYILKKQPHNIDGIVKQAIDSVKGKGYKAKYKVSGRSDMGLYKRGQA
jgi:hypothetical protein